jgi:hypothetical protein
MFSQLKEIGIDGEKRQRKDKYFMKQLSTGVYCTLSEKLVAFDPEGKEDMSLLRYQSIIVLLCLWEKNPEIGKHQPMLVSSVGELMKKREAKDFEYRPGEFSNYFRELSPKLFVETCDYFADKIGKDELVKLYHIADVTLQPTSDEVKDELKN